MGKIILTMKYQVLFVPDGWPANFFEDQMNAVSDLYEFKVILGTQETLGKKKAINQFIQHKIPAFSIKQDNIYRIHYSFINHLPSILGKKQSNWLMHRLDKCIRELYKGSQPDLVHIHQISDTAVFICEWAKSHQIPVVMSEHILFVRHETNRFQRLKELVYEKADMVLCGSNYQYRTLLTNGIKMQHTEIVGNLLLDSYVPEQFDSKFENRNIMFVASHLADKDIDVLLDAISFLKTDEFTNFHLDIIGIDRNREYQIDDNPRYNLQQDIKKRGLSELISIKGRKERKELLSSYRHYSFLVSSSLSETFGVGIAEAIMNGLPVVCTDSGGIRDFVDHTNGIIVPIRNPRAFADAIKKMFEQRAIYNPEAISNRIRKSFGQKAFREKLLRIYEELIPTFSTKTDL
jgi:glycosyltransferase involved in cell wall biosynthesis